MPKDAVIEVNHLTARFGNREVLSDINLNIYRNEITVILGGSGSGKTTLLKHIIGLHSDPEGSVKILEKRWKDLDQDEQNRLYLKMGVFYQNGALINTIAVYRDVASVQYAPESN
jgi:phospholipid/cholesterol/gamma-HCH transport system ATP-binding protein